MAVVDPLKLVLTNLPDGHEETLTFSEPSRRTRRFGTRAVPFSRELWIEREDFAEVPPKGFKRLVPGGEVRLRGAGIVRCDEVIKDGDGAVVELRGTLDPESRPGMAGADRKVKGTIHWVSAQHAVAAEIRLYDRLFTVPDPGRRRRRQDLPRPPQPGLARASCAAMSSRPRPQAAPEQSFQFERLGYFVADRRDHRRDAPVFNRSVTLRDTWAARPEERCTCVAHDPSASCCSSLLLSRRCAHARTHRRMSTARSRRRADAGRGAPPSPAQSRCHRRTTAPPHAAARCPPERVPSAGRRSTAPARPTPTARSRTSATAAAAMPGLRQRRQPDRSRRRAGRMRDARAWRRSAASRRSRACSCKQGQCRRRIGREPSGALMLYAQVHLTLPAWVHDAVDTARSYAGDEDKVALAIELSRRNIEARSGGPFGAAVFGADDRIIAVGVNRVLPHTCSLAHAEIMAYMLAQQRTAARAPQRERAGERVGPITLATSSQPCCQCYGATVWAGIDRLLIGARSRGRRGADRVRRRPAAGRLDRRTRTPRHRRDARPAARCRARGAARLRRDQRRRSRY